MALFDISPQVCRQRDDHRRRRALAGLLGGIVLCWRVIHAICLTLWLRGNLGLLATATVLIPLDSVFIVIFFIWRPALQSYKPFHVFANFCHAHSKRT